jgi:hypothetical protein
MDRESKSQNNKASNKFQTPEVKSNIQFTFRNQDESNISDDILSEGDVQVELIRSSVSLDHVKNPVYKSNMLRPSQFKREKLSIPLSKGSSFNIERISSCPLPERTECNRNYSNSPKAPRNTNSIVKIEESVPLNGGIRRWLDQLVDSRANLKSNFISVKSYKLMDELILAMKDVEGLSNSFENN